MKLFGKKKYLHPELMVADVDMKDVLGISSDAYDEDVFDPVNAGGLEV